jgi:protein-L-isoaspartate(D-aspartate) O-methyltransferase
MASSVELRHGLVETLVTSGALRTGAVQAAFGAVPRERFVPLLAATMGLEAIYADEVLVIQQRDGLPTSSSSQPSIMALMLEALDARPGHRVLEIGLGTGYNAALLSTLVGPGGTVSSVDIDETLVAAAARTLTDGGYEVATATADGRLGWPAGAPYDRIIVTASTPRIPRAWRDQLAPDGTLVVPVRVGALQAVAVFTRTEAGFGSTRLISGGFMPLRESPTAAGTAEAAVTLRVAVPGEPTVDLTASVPGLAGLSAKARGTLVGGLLARPSRRAVGPVSALPVIWHTALTSDPRQHIMVYRTQCAAFGLIDPAGGGCAQLVAEYRQGGWSDAVIESYGSAGQARAALLDHIRAWRSAGAPTFDDLAIEVRYHDTGDNAPRGWALRTIPGDDQDVSVGWPATPPTPAGPGPGRRSS